MYGDFTRFTFDRTKHYNRVLKQQGRVDLDADWNELNDIVQYLDETTRIDVIGKVGVPAHEPRFLDVTFDLGVLKISAGRIYVDGILVELDAPLIIPFEQRLAPALVYLDVWERHITAIEDPHIQETALGGPDTCTRVKTEFRVRVKRAAEGATCATAVLPGPPTGRLTAKAAPVPSSSDPCAMAHSGGFRGLENRLYRVEIHQGGRLGTATFKWSRDNGSIVFAVTEFPASEPDRVRVSRLGRDQVLAFRRGDWVEVLNDDNELDGTPGTLARIVDLVETTQTTPELQLSVNPPPSTPDKHPKVRRWDQPSDAFPTGVAPIQLEDGIEVSFSGVKERIKAVAEAAIGPQGKADQWNYFYAQIVGKPAPAPEDFGFTRPLSNITFEEWWAALTKYHFDTVADADFRAGDYWVIAARATGDIETLTEAAPNGVTHHYAPLAVVSWQASENQPKIELCPPEFPSLTNLPDPKPTPPSGGCCCCEKRERRPTRLLFPFVTNAQGYDTGIAITNTTGYLVTRPQRGRCRIIPCPALPHPVQQSFELGPCEQLTFSLSGGGSGGIAPMAGYTGALIVECDFAGAYGVAFITAFCALPTSPGVSECYLAVVLPRQPDCREAFPKEFVPFESGKLSQPDFIGDRVFIGKMTDQKYGRLQKEIALPDSLGQVFCGKIQLAPGLFVVAYVPSAEERAGDFSQFARPLIDPLSNQPFPNNIIPANRIPPTFAWRVRCADWVDEV